MIGYMVYWPQDRVKEIQKEGDVVFPVTLINKHLYVCARLPMEHREAAYDYLVRELRNQCGALVPDGVDGDKYYDTPLKSHLEHQEPFNCCSEWAVWGTQGSSIELRLMPDECLPELRFGYPKSKEKGLRFDKNGNVLSICLGATRRLAPDTLKIFESLF